MTSFINALENESNKIKTLNNAITYRSTKNNLVDLFFFIASSRYSSDKDVELIDIFNKSYIDYPLETLKILFYARDIRNGQGERRVFRLLYSQLIKIDIKTAIKNLTNIQEFGRWDDLINLINDDNNIITDEIIKIIKDQLIKDVNNLKSNNIYNISLLSKWMPSANTSSSNSKKLASILTKKLNYSPRFYRKTLSSLRKAINIVERKLTQKEYKSIDYSKLPSLALLKYKKAFQRNDKEKYVTYLNSLSKNKTKINTKTLTPIDIVKKYFNTNNSESDEILLTQAWNNLPNYMDSMQGLVVADVSGSMLSPNYTPISASISLALYIAERNKNKIFKNSFITFSKNPEFIKIKGNNLFNKLDYIKKANWGLNTNIQSTIDLILNTGINNKIPNEEMPKFLLIISDMEFDICGTNTNINEIRNKYNEVGYELPIIIFWNVNSKTTQIPAFNENGILLVSGFSPIILKFILSKNIINGNTLDLILEIINSDRYKKILLN